VLCNNGLWPPGKRWPTANALVEHASQGVEIAPPVDRAFAPGLFRAHVHQGPHCDAGPRQAIGARGGDGVCDAEVGEDSFASFEHDVLGLDVAVDNAVLMSVGQRGEHVVGDPHGLLDG